MNPKRAKHVGETRYNSSPTKIAKKLNLN